MSFLSEIESRQAMQIRKMVEVAHEKFRRFGIRRVKMDEIASDLRISKKTLYRFFETKEALVQACADMIMQTILPLAEAAVSRKGPVVDKFFAIFEALSKLPHLVSGELIRDIEADYPHIWRQIDERRHIMFDSFEKMILEGIEEGSVYADIHPKVLMRFWRAILDHVMVPEVLGQGEFTPGDAVRTLTALFRRGIIDPDGKKKGKRRS